MQRKSEKLKKNLAAIISAVVFAALAALTVLGHIFLNGKQYYLTAVLMIAAVCIPFLVSFEKKKPNSRELVMLACLTAIAVASRAAFYSVPSVKPLCAVVIITAACLGAQTGFVCGVFSMFASNFIFGQGMWTPFQMLGMGAVGLLAGAIFYNRKIRKNRILLAASGAIMAAVIYGLIVDLSSVLMMATEFSVKQIAAIYASGIPFNLSHGATTGIVLLFLGKPMIDKIERIKTKYGLYGG